ncbi:AGE family epimerase/isomerase [Haladaptatus halobius]|uniref:AGE family epimerase/isomerase n=1 Tax=Haladaptatus halobius TaxID=2884875 RepID=UPI002104D0B5|nr:AGE family epimerase/isomerase [Haladaptatus halobius]
MFDRYTDTAWALDRAEELFDATIEHSWDAEYGGFYYTFDRDGAPIVEDKYGWPVAEGIGAAAALSKRVGNERYRKWYDRLWEYAEANLTAPGWELVRETLPEERFLRDRAGFDCRPWLSPDRNLLRGAALLG